MSKGNLLLGMGRGSIGDITLSHYAGQQIARARNRNPRNNRTAPQMIQRVIMKTTSVAYSFLKDICDHSFEGKSQGTECQSRFAQRNIAMFRTEMGNVFAGGFAGSLDTELALNQYNFSKKDDFRPEINRYIVSEGSLEQIGARVYGTTVDNNVCIIPFKRALTNNLHYDYDQFTYADLLYALKLHQGDQLTLLALGCDDFYSVDETLFGDNRACKFNDFNYYRIIIDPAELVNNSLDQTPFLDDGAQGSLEEYCRIHAPNPRNRDVGVYFSVLKPGAEGADVMPYGALSFYFDDLDMRGGTSTTLAALSVIASRLDSNMWRRSSESLFVRPDVVEAPNDPTRLFRTHSVDTMGKAIRSYLSESNSGEYLNQATNEI